MAPQRLHVDWAGDAGPNTERLASRFVLVSIVQVQSDESLKRRIGQLRSDLHLPPDFEFHWARIGWKNRDAYLDRVRAEDFRAWVLIVDKVLVRAEYRNLSPNEALYLWIAEAFTLLPAEATSNAELIVDVGQKGQSIARDLRVEVSRVLARRGDERRLRSARGLPAHRSDELQLADMVAGAVRAWHVEKVKDYDPLLGKRVVVKHLAGEI